MRILKITAATAVLAVATLSAQAQQATDSNQYPVSRNVTAIESVNRPCTQLEHGAGIPADACGRIELNKVAKAYFEATSSGGDED